MEADPKCPQLTPGTMWNWYWDIIEKNFPTAIEWLLRLGRKNATFFDCQSWFSSLSKTAPRRPILDFDTIFGNVRRSPSLKEHPQPLSRPNERAIRGDGNGFYPRMILRFFGQKLSEIVYNRLQTGRGWQGVIRGLKTVATMCLHAQQFIKFGRAALTQFLRWSGSQEKAWPEINWALNAVRDGCVGITPRWDEPLGLGLFKGPNFATEIFGLKMISPPPFRTCPKIQLFW